MKNLTLLACFVILLVGCQSKETPPIVSEIPAVVATVAPSITPIPTHRATSTPILPSSTASATHTKTAIPTPTSTDTPSIPPETRLKLQCLEVAPTLPSRAASSGVVILNNGNLLDMATGQITQIAGGQEYLSSVAISPDNKFMAFDNVLSDPGGPITGRELVIATADGQRQEVVMFEEKWLDIVGWTNDQRLLLSVNEPVIASSDGHRIPISYLILNPFSGERQMLHPDFPGFFDITPLQWDGWRGVVYDPTLTRTIYPYFYGRDEEVYTFALWDVRQQQLVASLENMYTNGVGFSNASPMPRWSADGSYFAFVGQVLVSEQLVEFELYQVSSDGQVAQLSHLTPIAVLQGLQFSLSPDGQKIAMLLDTWYDAKQRHVALLNLKTLDVTDYCIPIKWEGGGTLLQEPIWSPDGEQFLVVDRHHVILVDIEQGFAAQVAEGMEPLGWMVAP
jgi:hypothetical protein